MKAIFAAAALAATSTALTLGSGATEDEHKSFIAFLASSGTSIDDSSEFNFREGMYAQMDRWINKQNEASMASGVSSPCQYGHNQFSTMTLREKA